MAIVPVVDLAPAAGLETLVVVQPKNLYAHADLRSALDALLPQDEILVFATRHGTADPRLLDEVVVATYSRATLVLAAGPMDPPRMEQAFGEHSLGIDGRAVDHPGGPLTTITRVWAQTNNVGGRNQHEELAVLGRQACAWEIDDPPIEGTPVATIGPLRASVLFAQKKLAKAKPALAAPPLDTVARTLGPAPLRVFFPGPFEGEWQSAMGGLLRAATAVGVAADGDGKGSLDVTVAVFGAFGDKSPQAAERLAGVVNVISESALGKLAGLDHPVASFQSRSTPEAAILQGRIDATKLVQGVRAATGAQISEMMKY